MISTHTTLPVALFKGAIGIYLLIIVPNRCWYRIPISWFPAGFPEKKICVRVGKRVILPRECYYRLDIYPTLYTLQTPTLLSSSEEFI